MEIVSGFIKANITPVPLENQPELGESFAWTVKSMRNFYDYNNYWSIPERHQQLCAHLLRNESNPFLRHTIAVTEEIARQVSTHLTPSELLSLTLERKIGVLSGFATDALNRMNNVFYQMSQAFSELEGSADYFRRSPSINEALAHYICREVASKKVSMIEFCSGGFSEKWKYFESSFYKNNRSASIELTDFVARELTKEANDAFQYPSLNFTSGKCDLLQDSLFREQKKDVALICYGFDSVWFPQDGYFVWDKSGLYQAKHRLIVNNLHPNFRSVVDSFKNERPVEDLYGRDLELVLIETLYEQVSEKRFGRFEQIFKSLTTDIPVGAASLPFGLIDKVDQAFSETLNEDGIFIIADVADNSFRDTSPYATSGAAGKYKRDNYDFASACLKDLGYEVECYRDSEFILSNTGNVIKSKDDVHTIIMIVRKRKN